MGRETLTSSEMQLLQEKVLEAATVAMVPSEMHALVNRVLDDAPLPSGTAPEIMELYNHFRLLLFTIGLSPEVLRTLITTIFEREDYSEASLLMRREIMAYALQYCEFPNASLLIQILVEKLGVKKEYVSSHLAELQFYALVYAIKLVSSRYGIGIHYSEVISPVLRFVRQADDQLEFILHFTFQHPQQGVLSFKIPFSLRFSQEIVMGHTRIPDVKKPGAVTGT